MRHVSTSYLLTQVIIAMGYKQSFTPPDNMRCKCINDISNTLAEAWRVTQWPQLMRIEKRRYRPDFDNTIQYNKNMEVWYKEQYYRKTTQEESNENPDVSKDWELIGGRSMSRFIQMDQPWEQHEIDQAGINLNRFAYTDDPRIDPEVRPIQGCKIWMQGVLLPVDAPNEIYIHYMPQADYLNGILHSPTHTYDYNDVIFHDGECWACNISHSTGDFSADFWRKIRIPEMFAPYIVAKLSALNKTEEQGRYHALADANKILDELVMVYTTGQGSPTITMGRY